jgi:CubicO group peptidase (beta-lactamase class C family)
MSAIRVVALAALFIPQTHGADLEATLRAELESTHTPGAAIAIVRGAKVEYIKGVGLANTETKTPVSPNMLFRLGSTTKMFTAATLVSFAVEGKLDLKAPLGQYLAGNYAVVLGCLTTITAHQLLTHSAGLKDVAPMFGSHDETALALNVRSWSPDYCEAAPGKQFKYSNPGYVLAGYLVEVLSEKFYADTVNERILKPLGMTHSTYRPTVAITYPLAQGHNREMQIIRPAADYAGAWPAGSLFSNVEDLSRWMIAFLNGGMLEGKQALSPAIIAKLSAPYIACAGKEGRQYGYGLEIQDGMLEHEGNRDGYGTVIRMYPERKLGIVILGNRTGVTFPRTLDAAERQFRP